MTRARAGALTVLGNNMFLGERRRLVDLAAKHRLPAVYTVREYIDAGGLMAYAPNLADVYRRAATLRSGRRRRRRELAEKLSERAIREERNIEAVVIALLEAAAKRWR